MNNVDWKDAGIRALKTFIAALVVTVPAAAVVNGDVSQLKAGAVSAGIATVTYVWNVLLSWSNE